MYPLGFLLYIWLAYAVCSGQVLITEWPENQVALVNTTTMLRCRVEQNKALLSHIFWDECISRGDGSCRRISNDETLLYQPLGGDPNRGARYSVDREVSAQFNLVIANVQPEDAGRYRCTASNANVYKEADIIVIEHNPDCHINITSNAFSDVGDDVMMTCGMTYEGRWAPRMYWKMNGEDYTGYVRDDTIGNDVRQTIVVQVQSDDDGTTFSVQTSFPMPDAVGRTSSSAMNNPAYNYTVTFHPLNVRSELETTVPISDTSSLRSVLNSRVLVTAAPVIGPASASVGESSPSTLGTIVIFSLVTLILVLLISLSFNLMLILHVRGTNFCPVLSSFFNKILNMPRPTNHERSGSTQTTI